MKAKKMSINQISYLRQCCNPEAPHDNKDKFLLLGNGDHEENPFGCGVDGYFQVINNQCPTNIRNFNDEMIRGRRGDIYRVTQALHPNPFGKCKFNVATLYGRRKMGTTSTALLVGKFFSRKWYEPIFPCGVWYVDMKNETNLASSMKLKEVSTQFLHSNLNFSDKDIDNKEQEKDQGKPKYVAYNQTINEKLLQFQASLNSNTIDKSFHYRDVDHKHHFVFFKKAAKLREREKLAEIIDVYYDAGEDEIEQI